MTTLNRLVIDWTGPQIVGRAVTVLHYSGSDASVPNLGAIKTALTAAGGQFPSGVTWTIPNEGDQIRDTDGALVGVWAGTGGGSATANGGVNAAAGVGACIGWTTGGIVNGTKGPRKLRGRTFLVPLSAGAYQSDGTLSPLCITDLTALGQAFRNAGPLAVWHRPLAPGAADGNSYGVVSHKVRDKVAVLRSRRD